MWRCFAGCFLVSLVMARVWGPACGAETNMVLPATVVQFEETNLQQTLHAILQLEGQVRSNRLAIEQSGVEARELAARNADVFSNGLHTIQNALSAQQATFSTRSAEQLETLRSSSRLMLVLWGTFAAIALLAMLIIAYFQWRMSKAWAGIAAELPHAQGLSHSSALPVIDAETPQGLAAGPAPDMNGRLLGAMEQLERRIMQLEQRLVPVSTPRSLALAPGDNGESFAPSNGGTTKQDAEPGLGDELARVATLLGQGKSLFNGNDWEGAIARFDEVLSIDPKHGEALVKKGAALERLQKLNEAFECYDRAIAADGSRTIAYLHKGGLFNRLERFKEALECYEKALKAHDDRHG